MAASIPVDKGSEEATFTALAKDFGLDDSIRSLFLGGPMVILKDFRYYFADKKKIDAFVAAEKPRSSLRTTTCRWLRQLWSWRGAHFMVFRSELYGWQSPFIIRSERDTVAIDWKLHMLW